MRLKLGEQAMFPELAVQLAPGNPQSPGGQHLVVAGIDQRVPQYLAFGPGAGFLKVLTVLAGALRIGYRPGYGRRLQFTHKAGRKVLDSQHGLIIP